MNTTSAEQLARAIFLETLAEHSGDLPTVQGYTIVREIGRGGGGVVYEAIPDAAERSVAVKFMHSLCGRPTERVFHEIDRLNDIRSDAVPHIYEHGWCDGQMYLVMEFIDGMPLLEYAGGLGLRERVDLLARVAEAVWELNEHGVIHRDLKPSNILVSEKGVPVIVDLGIAMLLGDEGDEGPGADGAAVGTLAYMAPEQARGVRAEVTTRSDVYSLGAIGYELLTGSTPNELAPTVTQTVRRLQKEPPRPARTLRPDLPKSLAHILEHACAFEAADRYGSAALMRDDLRRWLNGEPISVGPQTLWMRFARLTIRHPVATVALLCLLISFTLLASVSAVVWWQTLQPYRFLYEEGDRRGSIISIISRSGLMLHTWETESPTGIVFGGQILEGVDGGYAVIGLAEPDRDTGVVGLAGYRLGSYDEPAWVAEQHLPDSLLYSIRFEEPPHAFQVLVLKVRDVFPEVPGREVISSHRHRPFSASCIQIHSADGRLLCEYWHDGWVESLYWEPKHGQLYATAKNSDGTWLERGESENWAGNYPVVLFAIKPVQGDIGVVIDMTDDQPDPRVVGYRCLLPGSAYRFMDKSQGGGELVFHVHRAGSAAEFQAGYVEFQLGPGTGIGHATMVIDPDLNLVRVWASDTWSRENDGASPDIFYLGDLPERVTTRMLKEDLVE